MTMVLRILNLGGGKDRSIPNAVNVDISPDVSPDIVHNLNRFPWPFKESEFDAIYCKDVLEHLENLVGVMEEIHRVSKPGGRVYITTPHFSCANSYTDPTHCQHLGLHSFDYFTGDRREDWYTPVRFKKIRADLFFHLKWKNKLVWRLAKWRPDFYEEHLPWIFPAWFMYFELEVMK